MDFIVSKQADPAKAVDSIACTAFSCSDLPESACPKDKEGNILPKVAIRTDKGVVYAFKNSVANLPISFPAEGIALNITFRNVKAKNKAGVEQDFSNILRAEFDSALRYIVQHAQSVAIAGVR